MGALGPFAGGGEDDGDDNEETWERLSIAPLMATLLLPVLIGAILVIKCVFGHCFPRKTSTKEEMYGLEGRMTMLPNSDAVFLTAPSNTISNSTNDATQTHAHATTSRQYSAALTLENEEATKKGKILNNNHPDHSTGMGMDIVINPLSNSSNSIDLSLFRSDHEHLTDSLKRGTGKRQLPELPQLPHQSLPRRSSSAGSHDGTSELYATVGEMPNPYAQLKTRNSLPETSSQNQQPSTSRGLSMLKSEPNHNPSSDSETYATANHPYAKLKRNTNEHPYARVRSSANANNDEETDTDNYDLPQPYAQRGRGAPPTVPSVDNERPENGGPVPPRRPGRQWRRHNGEQQLQAQNSADSASHFSGDSQDSRGYTSISVREPLSNIRDQMARGGRNGDPHYATVSDDSEEMYAAIMDDSADGNYMQIDGDRPNRPLWLDTANMSSPIPERREANSPLPPVPAVPPPHLLEENAEGNEMILPPSPAQSPHCSNPPTSAPLYAQVTKKSKKSKAPAAPTMSNTSTSSQKKEEEAQESSSSFAHASSSHHSHHHRHHHRNKSRTLMDNSNLLESDVSDPRRWSKADISYSEFEVVRETLLPSPEALKKSPVTLTFSNERQHLPLSPRDSGTSASRFPLPPIGLVDEDNYNLIPEKVQAENHLRSRLDSGNYQEIEPLTMTSNNTYQEIGGGKESSDFYQDDLDSGGSGFYQEIKGKGNRDPEDFEDEEEEEDQFYEKVRPSTNSNSTTSNSTLPVPLPAENLLKGRRQHGYEKIKRKKNSPSPNNRRRVLPDDEDEEEDGDENDFYEKVKYPPYERLKESKSDLAVDIEDDEDDFYERIGPKVHKTTNNVSTMSSTNNVPSEIPEYSVVNKPKKKKSQETSTMPIEEASCDPDLNQLYAVVDKSRKKGKQQGPPKSSSLVNNNNNNPMNHNNNSVSVSSNLSSAIYSTATPPNSHRLTFTPARSHRNAQQGTFSLHASGPDFEFIDDGNEIEYI